MAPAMQGGVVRRDQDLSPDGLRLKYLVAKPCICVLKLKRMKQTLVGDNWLIASPSKPGEHVGAGRISVVI